SSTICRSARDSAARIARVSLYLGFDSSTQGLTGIVLEITGSERRVVFQRSLDFDRDFPHYGTRSGVLPHADPLVATSSPLLWAEALDRFMGTLVRDSRLDLSRLRAVSGAAQQHGSVYLNGAATAGLARLDPRQPLIGELRGMLSRAEAPIWMDSSTTAQCAAIAAPAGETAPPPRPPEPRPSERFPGPQIARPTEQARR